MLSHVYALAALALLTLAPPASAQDATATVTDQIEAYLAASHAAGQFNGAALVADDGDVIYSGAFGEADTSWEIPNTADTRFRIAS